MKIYTHLLALSALQGASAFFVHSPKTSSTALASTPPPGPPPPPPVSGAPATVNPVTGAGQGPVGRVPNDPWGIIPDLKIEGNTLRTYPFDRPTSDSELVVLETDGRPLNANVDLWIGPDWTPYSMKIYSEDGLVRPVRTIIGTKGAANTLAIRNVGAMEFPLMATADQAVGPLNLGNIVDGIRSREGRGRRVDGGAVYTKPFPPVIDRVQVLLQTDGMKLNARIELLQGPNNIKQAFELHTNGGKDRPFYVLLDTPGSGNVVRVVNLSTVEFPLNAFMIEG